MMKAWSLRFKTIVYNNLEALLGSPVPDWMKLGWLCPIPKAVDANTREGHRPVMLDEVLRKCWIGLIIFKSPKTGTSMISYIMPNMDFDQSEVQILPSLGFRLCLSNQLGLSPLSLSPQGTCPKRLTLLAKIFLDSVGPGWEPPLILRNFWYH